MIRCVGWPGVVAFAVGWAAGEGPRRGVFEDWPVRFDGHPEERMTVRWWRRWRVVMYVGRPSRRRPRDRGGERERELRARLTGALA